MHIFRFNRIRISVSDIKPFFGLRWYLTLVVFMGLVAGLTIAALVPGHPPCDNGNWNGNHAPGCTHPCGASPVHSSCMRAVQPWMLAITLPERCRNPGWVTETGTIGWSAAEEESLPLVSRMHPLRFLSMHSEFHVCELQSMMQSHSP